MLIGNRYSDNKLYNGIKYYDGLPLTSRDIHEYIDTISMKNSYLLNNIIGSGILNKPNILRSSTGIRLETPVVVLLDGDIVLIQSTEEILKVDDIDSPDLYDGVLCVVGWYQSLTVDSTLREYGGVKNAIRTNDLEDEILEVQTSTRYQFRWDTVLIPKSTFYSEDSVISFELLNRDSTGETLPGSILVSTDSKIGEVRVAEKPSSMEYAASNLYIIPLIQYVLQDQSLVSTSITERSYSITKVPSLVREVKTIEIDTNNTKESDITLSIGIDSHDSSGLLQVSYNGALLIEGINYSMNLEDRTITLLGFTTEVGDQVTLVSTRISESES